MQTMTGLSGSGAALMPDRGEVRARSASKFWSFCDNAVFDLVIREDDWVGGRCRAAGIVNENDQVP